MAQEQAGKKRKGPITQTLGNKQILHFVGFGTYKIQDQLTLTNLLRKGLEIGYCKHIDSARYYNNQIALGKAIKTVISEDRCKRSDLFITTKSFNHIHSNPVLQLKQALRLMQLDYVDVYYLHYPLVDIDHTTSKWLHRSLEQCWLLFQECVRKGYTKYLGISNFNGQLMNQLLTFCKIKPLLLQIQTHPYLLQQNLVEAAQKNGIYVFAHTPLGRGENYSGSITLLKDQIIQQLSLKYGKTPAQIVLKSSLHRKVGVIPKTCNINRIQENWECWTVQLTQDYMKKIRNINKKLRVCDATTLFSDFKIFDN